MADLNNKLLEYLPGFLQKPREIKVLCDTQQVEFDTLEACIVDVFNQRFIDKATWGLALWEKTYGVETDESKPLDQRRSVVKAKMRGSGVVTKDMIKNIAAAFLNGQVEVAENFEAVSIDITFTDYAGVPPNRDDLTKTLRELIPAHLGINYILEYLTWDAMDALNLTWDELDALNLTWDELEVYK